MPETSDRKDGDGQIGGEGCARACMVPVASSVPRLRRLDVLPRFRWTSALALVAGILAVAMRPASASPADEAMRSPILVGKLTEFRQACSDEIVDAKPTTVRVGPGVTAVLVKFTSSKGLCFGQPGENDYLLVEGAPGWRSVLAAEPGSIQVGRPDAEGFAGVTLYGLGMCRITYRRTGAGLKAKASKDCHGLNGSPSLLDVTKAVRN